MKIELIPGVFWDNDLSLSEQTTEAQKWYTDNVQSKLAYDKSSIGIQPEWDDSRRPVQWVVLVGNIEVTIKWNYIKPETSEWAKSEDTITIKTI
jgi:hypothetical protein